jgi:hypothetical protein
MPGQDLFFIQKGNTHHSQNGVAKVDNHELSRLNKKIVGTLRLLFIGVVDQDMEKTSVGTVYILEGLDN